jgi:hypothetical protein
MMDWLVITVLLAVGLAVGFSISAAATGLWGAARVAIGVVLVFTVFALGLSVAFLYEDAHPRQCQDVDRSEP